jgi:hypothetical protein
MRISISKSLYDYEHVANVLNTSNVGTFVTVDKFKKIIQSKKYHNIYTTKTDTRDNASAILKRIEQENRILFGQNTIYGMLVNHTVLQNEFTGKGFGYGDICLVWSDAVKAQSKATLGDSIFLDRISGDPTLNLHYGVTGRQVQHWLAQYGISYGSERTFFNQENGQYRAKVNLLKFNVDFKSLHTSIGMKYSQFVEVTCGKPLAFPYDFKAIVVNNLKWRKQLHDYFGDNIKVLMLNEYEELDAL